uniref:MT domain-containing protein n=1 Tax=Steinernema glaseri TaxID=37863 RepID=A0A1I8A0M0_9BILA
PSSNSRATAADDATTTPTQTMGRETTTGGDKMAELMDIIKQQQESIAALLKATATAPAPSAASAVLDKKQILMEKLANTMEIFAYDEAIDSTFDTWIARYDVVFRKDGEDLQDEDRVRLLLRKLTTDTYNRYAKLLLPLKPTDLDFATTIDKMTCFFGHRESLFRSRY